MRLFIAFSFLLTTLHPGSSVPVFENVDVWKEPPLILTQYIESGKIQEARDKSLVTALKPNIVSYAGFFNVDKQCDSNLFFWFFPSQSNPKTDPVSVWLNGGPGTSSTLGLLTENGPYDLTLKGELKLRKYSWNRNSSVVYFDNPVGAGYSFTKGSFEKCYPRNQTQVGQSFLVALEQFFKLFPELRDNPFYLTGESYAGKYIPGIAYAIHKSKTSIKLAGIAIGNGWTDPYTQLKNSEFFYNLGIIDDKFKDQLIKTEDKAQDLIRQSRFVEARDLETQALRSFSEKSGYRTVYNFLVAPGEITPDYTAFMNTTEVRKALHIGNAFLNRGQLASASLAADVMRSIKPWLEELMDKYRVLLYFGQMDMRVGYPPAMGYIKTLKWKGAEEYKNAERKLYRVDGELAGYVKTAGNFSEILIRNAGHMVPTNQPKWSLDMYNKFIFNLPFVDKKMDEPPTL